MVPAPTEATIRPATIGSIRTPDIVALTPSQYCRKVGRNVIVPSRANPTMKLRVELTLNTFSRKSRSGRIGSAARCSAYTNATRQNTAPTTSPMIVGEPQAYWTPPQLVARIRPAEPSEMNTIPKVSKTGFAVAATDGRSLIANGKISSATGTLM